MTHTIYKYRPRLFHVALVAGTACGIWLTTAHTLAEVTRVGRPDLALRARPHDPIALAVRADELLLTDLRRPATRESIESLAKMSLNAQALNPRALRILSFVSQLNGEGPLPRQLASLALRTSRREVGVHLWMIEHYVARNDISGALRHYDLALRTSIESSSALGQVLSRAIAEPRIQVALVPVLKQRPPWLARFLQDAVDGGADPTDVADLIERSGGLAASAQYLELENRLLNLLVEKGHLQRAKAHYLTLRGADTKLLVSAALTNSSVSDRFSFAAWRAVNSSSAGIDVASGPNNRSSIRAFASPGDFETVATKLLFLTPGQYVFGVKFGRSEVPSGSMIKWSMVCKSEKETPVIWESGPLKPSDGFAFRASIDIQDGCTAQSLELTIAGGQEQTGAEILIEAIDIRPA